MPLSVLDERIASLRRDLKRANAASDTERKFAQLKLKHEPWIKAFDDIRSNSTNGLELLKDLGTKVAQGSLDPSEAWQEYSKIEGLSEEVFRECLELLGGLVFREKELDEQICVFADELIKECAKSVGLTPTLVIPSPDRVPPVDLRRIAHIRFPEWDVWALPLVAHEYGRVAIAEHDKANEFAKKTARDLHKHLAAGPAVELEAVEQRVRVLLADAFATFTHGPAYACALMLLRLDVVAPSLAARALVRQRADMVTGIIDALDTRGRIKEHLGQEPARCWKLAIASLPRAPAAAADPLGSLTLDPAAVFDKLVKTFHPGTDYTLEDWDTAVRWGSDWIQQLDTAAEVPRLSDVLPTHRLRDALNASWYVRIQQPGWATDGARVTRDLCQNIIAVHASEPSGQGIVRGKSRPQEGG
ncbi:hypothetical protein [Streptomyces lunaelactis]|uniref:hypothetical protein n=1 Tax=Streptomyces lunaelactis TaxID=1535768 RepID=UPI0015858795|nr:hypothetical protein [Streptomyces lunaelactis]NUK01527.1 hypothetical protein [Streptomyces lunaelactis]NUK20338.1 hypothetical protein [Streptomyces lunaelactis]